MIRNVLVNGVQVTNQYTFLKKLSNIVDPKVDVSIYQRGGASGQVLSRPLLRGYAITLEFTVIGTDVNTFITQRERLIGYFQNASTSPYTKTLGFELANGIVKELDVVFSGITGDLAPENILHSEFTVTAASETEHFVDNDTEAVELQLFTLGGMAIPMGIPMNMANNPTGSVTVATNSGNAPAFPIFRVYGAFGTSFTLSNDTNLLSLAYTGALTSSDYVDLDFYNRTAVKNATTNVLANISGDWWTIDPGDNNLKITGGVADDGYTDLTYHHTFRNL